MLKRRKIKNVILVEPVPVYGPKRTPKTLARKTMVGSVHFGKRRIATASILLWLLILPLFYAGFAFAAYSVTINTVYNGINNGVAVSIMMDGVSTGFTTPHTFTGLSGTHNFTVPYEDAVGHPFRRWDTTTPGDQSLSTVKVSSGGSFWAFYDTYLPRGNGGATNSVSAAEQRYFVTPSDPAVIAAASGKSWSDILNWVASHITYNYSCSIWQFPNETLAQGSGQCREFSTLAVSMLLALGHVAYIVSGDVTAASGIDVSGGNGHVWIAIQINGTLYHFEPQRTWANQPTPQNFSGYLPEHFNDDAVLFSAVASLDPPAAETYDVTVHTNYNGIFDGVHVPITQDGATTGFSTPHTFAGLTDSHNFTVPYTDGASHPFMCWGVNYKGNKALTTIFVTLGGSFSAFYDTGIDLGNLYAAEYMYLITPQDPAVLTAAAGKNVSGIVDFVSAVAFAYNNAPQYPNQTLSSGTRYFLDYASLCVSMLRARGYVAYLVGGNASGETGGRWVVFSLNGVFYHVDPAYSWANQQTVNFGTYQPSYYVDERGIYPPGVSRNPPASLPATTATPNPTTSTPSPTQSLTPTPSNTMTWPPPSPTPTLTGSPSGTATSPTSGSPSSSIPPTPVTSATMSPSPPVPEIPALWASFVVVAGIVVVTVFLLRKARKKQEKC